MTDQLSALTTVFTEFYYWITVVLMFLIHAGFCMYELGASRYKHHQHTLRMHDQNTTRTTPPEHQERTIRTY